MAPIPGVEGIVEQAVSQAIAMASQRGWEAVVLVAIIVCVCLLAAYLIKWVLRDSAEREARMSKRINDLETYIETILADRLQDCTKALVESTNAINNLIGVVDRLGKALTERPCFWNSERQGLIISEIVDRLSAK